MYWPIGTEKRPLSSVRPTKQAFAHTVTTASAIAAPWSSTRRPVTACTQAPPGSPAPPEGDASGTHAGIEPSAPTSSAALHRDDTRSRYHGVEPAAPGRYHRCGGRAMTPSTEHPAASLPESMRVEYAAVIV